jgi:outer membrane protein insertion porin family
VCRISTPMFLSVLSVWLITSLLAGAPTAPAPPTIRHVEVEGNSRVPALSILRQVSAKPELPFDAAKSEQDIKKLYDMGFFEDVQVSSRDAGEGQIDLIYRVREYPYISSFSIEGIDEKLEDQIRTELKKEKLELLPATPFRPSAANKAAMTVRDFLRSRKHPNADVKVITQKQGTGLRVLYQVDPGQRLEVGSVKFAGNESIPESELLKQMKHSRPAPFWSRWAGAACYIPDELASDLQRIRLYYRSQGFAEATVGAPHIQASARGDKQHIEIDIPVYEGSRYRLTSFKVEGNIKSGAAEINKLVKSVPTLSQYNYSLLESTRQKVADVLGHYGYALARVDLEHSSDEEARTIQAVLRINTGEPVVVGRIQFVGNYRIPDKFLRREIRAREGEIYDSAKLDESVRRLNKSNLLKELRREDVALKMNEETNLLDVTFNVKERDHQGIYGTGGTGGIGGGYLGLIFTAFNLLHLGESLSMELDGGAAQSNMLLNIIGTHFLGTPFTLGLSVFDRYTNLNVANIVPGPESLVSVLLRRSAGAGLSGAYPLSTNLQAGMGFQVEHDSISNSSPGVGIVPGRSFRSEVAPFLLFDKTTGSGPATRGYRLSYSQGLDGSVFSRSIDSTRESVQITRYAGDPFTKGRNSFAFQLQGALVRPHAGGPLFLENRFYPGNETVRGFSRGSLSPWVAVPSESGDRLQAAGADTVLGFSTEYRVPISGPLSGVAFFDLGWTHLDQGAVSQLGTGARLIDKTNGLLRASLGGELRLQLPMIRQPARLIFSWNPLRLNTFFSSPSSVLRLVEPRKSLRFALGTFY